MEKRKGELRLETAYLKLASIQFCAMKSLSTILSCNYFAEYILVPKKRRHGRPSMNEAQDKDDPNNGPQSTGLCPKCGKLIPVNNDGECPYCVEISNLQSALAEAFASFVNVSKILNQFKFSFLLCRSSRKYDYEFSLHEILCSLGKCQAVQVSQTSPDFGIGASPNSYPPPACQTTVGFTRTAVYVPSRLFRRPNELNASFD